MNQSERSPDRMIAAEHKTVSRPSQDRLHTAPVSFNASGARIMEFAAMDRAPEVGVKLEIGAAPFASHGSEQLREVFLHFGVRTVQYVPWSVPPASKRNPV